MLREFNGDLFTSDAPAIGHGVNCLGMMGAGIAVEFKRRYPEMYEEYKWRCEKGSLLPGDVYIYQGEKFVVNLASQFNPGADARILWLKNSLMQACHVLRGSVYSVDTLALPRIGCGIGGLNWDDVREIIEDVAITNDMTIEVWSL